MNITFDPEPLARRDLYNDSVFKSPAPVFDGPFGF